ncbi:MAG TPA: type II toxin-antitoxin system VapC family toxin [Planctomicrobium sp.]|nr:type II toxin-antitoxin system VapC family toxin [Planctomicrobium sp.]
MKFLLDTNVWIAYLRGKNPLIRERIVTRTADEIVLCSVVLGELFHGVLRSENVVRNRSAVDALVSPYVCLPFAAEAADRFAAIRHYLETAGTPIGPYDLQIAAIALAHGCTVVTHNTAEFSRIPGLLIEDWESP